MLDLSKYQQNSILAGLGADELKQIAPHLELVTLSCAQVVYEMNEELKYAYFPPTAIASLACTLKDGSSVQVAMVGNEGMLGISVSMGGGIALTQATISISGSCYRISTKSLQEALNRSGGRRTGILQQLLQNYAQSLMVEMAQTTACNRRHSIDQHLCRWLLLNIDRVNSNSLAMTHEFIAQMLGVRRESISEAAQRLQQASIISYHRGHIDIIKKSQLESRACECYSILKQKKPSSKSANMLHAA